MLRFPERLALLFLLAAATPATAENLLANPHFDGSLAGWTAAPGAAWSSADVAGSAGSGSASGSNSSPEGDLAVLQVSQCVPVTSGDIYDVGVRVLVADGQSRTGSAPVVVQWYDEEGCAGSPVFTETVGTATIPLTWMTISDSLSAPATSSSAVLALFVDKNEAGGTFAAHFDNASFCSEGSCDEGPVDAPWLTSAEVPDFRFRVRITAGASSFAGAREASCQPDTLCVSGAVPGRPEVFLRVLGPRPNGFLWPTIVRFTPSRVEVEVEQLSSGESKTYVLPAVPPGVDDLPGLQDRTGFQP